MVICKCLQIRALNQEDDQSLMVNLFEQKALEYCDLMERFYASKTGEKKFPRRALIMCPDLLLTTITAAKKSTLHCVKWGISVYVLEKHFGKRRDSVR